MEFMMGANCEGEWSSLSGMYTAEEADFMAQLLGNCSFPSQSHGHEEGFTPRCSFPVPSHDQGHHDCLSQDMMMSSMSMEFSCLFEGRHDDCLNHQETDAAEGREVEPAREEKCNIPRKRTRTRNSSDVPRSKRAKKINKKVVPHCSNEEDGSGGVNVQSSSSCSEDDDSNGSQENSGSGSKRAPALNSNGKSRASRGSATDPQSLYARKRRERINERLRILQNLVPNGTKVDISTMLEEAVQYVKFLQLQIKLLSSDDMWMYAPIAYNGMDIGLDFKVPATRES